VDTDLKIKSLESDYRQQASDQLKIAMVRMSEIQQELRKSTDASQRQVIVAPAAGEVMNLRFTSAGTVLSPREPIVDIVPTNPRLLVEAQIRPEDIRRVQQDQPAHIRFSAYNALTTPMVEGKVVYVSADRNVDRQTQQAWYTVMIEADAASLHNAGRLSMQAGMPAEVFIQGEERTPLQYLVEPVTLLLNRRDASAEVQVCRRVGGDAFAQSTGRGAGSSCRARRRPTHGPEPSGLRYPLTGGAPTLRRSFPALPRKPTHEDRPGRPLIESVPPQTYGGTERVVHYLTEALVDLGHEVTLFASGDSRHVRPAGAHRRPRAAAASAQARPRHLAHA
jgi:hypothetical protein